VRSVHRAYSSTDIPPCKIKPTSTPICALLRPANVEDAPRGGAPRRGTVTYERQRDSDGLAALSGQITATVAQTRRRKKPTIGLSSRMRLGTFRRVAAVSGFRSTTQTGTRASREQGAAGRALGRMATRLKARETLLWLDHARAALTHHLQFQLDRETDLWLERQQTRACEICGVATTLRARLGRDTKPRVLCADHQSSHCLQLLYQRRTACAS